MTGDARRLFLLAGSFALVLVALFVADLRAAEAEYRCTQADATRQVAVVHEAGYACRVKYTRSTGITYPWSARNDSAYCTLKAAALVERLGGFGWACEAVNEELPPEGAEAGDDPQTAAEVQEALLAQLERYERYISILGNIGKACHFYPGNAQYGNLCGDGYAEAAIVYTCETAGEHWEQHLAVFIDTEEKPLLREVGSLGSLQVIGYYIDDNLLTIESERLRADGEDTPSDESMTTTRFGCRYDADKRLELFEQP